MCGSVCCVQCVLLCDITWQETPSSLFSAVPTILARRFRLLRIADFSVLYSAAEADPAAGGLTMSPTPSWPLKATRCFGQSASYDRAEQKRLDSSRASME